MGQGTDSCGGWEVEYDDYDFRESDGYSYWTERSGKKISIHKMSDRHIKNTIKLCENLSLTETFSCDSEKWEDWVEVLEFELASRKERKLVKPSLNDKPVRGTKLKLKCHCGEIYNARIADLKRGWGKSCCKRCAAIKRDFGRPDPICAETGKSFKELL